MRYELFLFACLFYLLNELSQQRHRHCWLTHRHPVKISDLIRQLPNPLPDYLLDVSYSSLDSCCLTSPQIGPDRIPPAPPHLAANRTGSDPSCSPRRRSDRILPAPRKERTPAVPLPVGWTRPSSNHRIQRSNKLQIKGSGYFSCFWESCFMSRKLHCCPLPWVSFCCLPRAPRPEADGQSAAGRQRGNHGTGFPGRDLNLALLPGKKPEWSLVPSGQDFQDFINPC